MSIERFPHAHEIMNSLEEFTPAKSELPGSAR
jgi:hypothetical protein